MQFASNAALKVDPSKRARRWLIWGGVLTTLAFWSNARDPFNAPKSWILQISAFWIFGWIITQTKTQISNKTIKTGALLALAFWMALTFAFIFTDVKYIGLFGDYQRRTGYLTYTSLVFFFLGALYLIRQNNLITLERAAIFVGTSLSLYGIAQHFGKDVVKWNNPYNPVIGTLGNPDFVAAVMAIFAVLNFGISINTNRKSWERLIGFTNVILLLVAIQFSQGRQGLITSFIGISIVLISWVYQKNKQVSIVLAVLGIFGLIASILGMLNFGPLVSVFYKRTISLRGDYWRAAWNMFKNHPLTGVGLDRYGANFRIFRDFKQVHRGGPNVVSNAAHSVPIQLAATGGLLLFLTYLALTLFIAWRGWIAISHAKGTQKIANSAVVGAWVAYEAQSLISIDNIGIAIWGYILGGIVVGISEKKNSEDPKLIKLSNIQPVLSILLAAILLLNSSLFFQNETNMRYAESVSAPSKPTDLQYYLNILNKPVSNIYKEPAFELGIAVKMVSAGNSNEAILKLRNLIANDPKYYDSYELLAQIYEYLNKWKEAATVRDQIRVLDKFNSNNETKLKFDQEKSI